MVISRLVNLPIISARAAAMFIANLSHLAVPIRAYIPFDKGLSMRPSKTMTEAR